VNDTYAAFHEFFEIVEADSAELMQEVHKLRYKVFCVEQKIFDYRNFPDGMEKDEYDPHSTSILLKHRASGDYIGTVRLVLQDKRNPNKAFPVEKNLQFDPNLIDMSRLARQHVAEISRFAILRQFSKRRLEQHNGENRFLNKKKNVMERRRFPSIGLALVVGIVRMCVEHNIDHWLSAMDPALNRLLISYGSHLHPVGPLIDYYGMRRPYHIKLIDVLSRMYYHHHDIWELVTEYGKACPYSMSYIQPEKVPMFDSMLLLNN
jgi:N-acyl amino acid synthase of PEP-CTERM/exosortase system